MRDPDELTDDDDGCITVTPCAVLHGRVNAKVSQWMDSWDNDNARGGMEAQEPTDTELANMEAEEIDDKDVWPEHSMSPEKTGESQGQKSLGPSFAQLDLKRKLALVETMEMGWEVFDEGHESVSTTLPVIATESW